MAVSVVDVQSTYSKCGPWTVVSEASGSKLEAKDLLTQNFWK